MRDVMRSIWASVWASVCVAYWYMLGRRLFDEELLAVVHYNRYMGTDYIRDALDRIRALVYSSKIPYEVKELKLQRVQEFKSIYVTRSINMTVSRKPVRRPQNTKLLKKLLNRDQLDTLSQLENHKWSLRFIRFHNRPEDNDAVSNINYTIYLANDSLTEYRILGEHGELVYVDPSVIR